MDTRRVGARLLRQLRLCGRLSSDRAADIDEIVGDDPEADPALHSIVAGISASLETVSAFAYTDASLAPGAPSLPAAEPSLLLFSLAAALLLERLGMQTRLTPLAFAAISFLAE